MEPTSSAMLRDRVIAAIGAQYAVGAEIGSGGMSVVYEAVDRRLQRPVAIKVLPPDLAFRREVRERFVREAQMAARLNHPHIVPIYAVHEHPDLVCFAMALVRGEALGAVLARTPRPEVMFVARVLEEMADGLAYAHAAGVVHRDVKPDNVLLDRDSGRVQLMDFGIARAVETTTRLTATGVAVGTPAFMSPEQAEGAREIDGRSDVYGVGVVGYLMLAGRPPFTADSTPALLLKHLSEAPPSLAQVAPDIPHDLAAIVERCLAKRPEARWPSALALRDALRGWQRDPARQDPARQDPARQDPARQDPARQDPMRRETAGVTGAPAPASARPATVVPRFGGRSEDWSPRPVGVSAPVAVDPPASRIPALMRGLRRHMIVLLTAMWIALVSLIIGASADLGVMVIPMVIAGLVAFGALQVVIVDLVRLRRAGVSVLAAFRALLSGRRGDLPPSSASSADRYALLVSPSVRASPVGPVVEQAVSDRCAIDEVLLRLSSADRALVPDIAATADALLERITGLAAALERLGRGVAGEDPAALRARMAAARTAAAQAEPATAPERERHLLLLQRQADALDELAARRETMERQLDHAALTLRSLRLDIARLDAMGLEASHRDLDGTTQEAQAMSRDLGHVIDSVREAARTARAARPTSSVDTPTPTPP